MRQNHTNQFPSYLLIALGAAGIAGLSACVSDSVEEPEPLVPVVADTAYDVFANLAPGAKFDTVINLRADTGANEVKPFAYFDLDTKSTLNASGDTSAWDLAFRATGIRVRGGMQLVDGDFDAVTLAPESGYAENAPAPAWYDYSGPPSHLITPKPGKTLVVKTVGGLFAKVSIISYYKGNPVSIAATDTARYYTFRYLIQKDGSRNLTPTSPPRTYFSFGKKEVVEDSTGDWDVAFRTTSVTVKGEAQLLTGVNFDGVAEAPEAGYGSGALPSWYDYNLDGNHTITPKVGAVYVIKTSSGKYAKLQVLSYYQGNPMTPSGTQHTARYYTFRYVYQPDGSRQF